ncbi:hypothetical protein [Jiangella endophytica]|uniref:hypothetical protein n=1 Tax=Jiangella endophytica TaxID=1623398 RepID=UPI0013009FE0|nr:hypothetical protein [Jiangella endophytica]
MSGDGKRHTDEEIQAAAERFEKWADELEPEDFEVIDLTGPRAVDDQTPADEEE